MLESALRSAFFVACNCYSPQLWRFSWPPVPLLLKEQPPHLSMPLLLRLNFKATAGAAGCGLKTLGRRFNTPWSWG